MIALKFTNIFSEYNSHIHVFDLHVKNGMSEVIYAKLNSLEIAFQFRNSSFKESYENNSIYFAKQKK